MTVTFEGQEPLYSRAPSGLWTLDNIGLGFQGETGMLLRSLYEIFGPPGSGKSTLAYYLAGRVPPQKGEVVICDLEQTLDKNYVVKAVGQSGFSGVVRTIDYRDPKASKRKNDQGRPHEDMMDDLENAIMRKDTIAGVLDSVGMMTPIAEREAKLRDTVWGKRAQKVAMFSRRAANRLALAPDQRILVVVNHQHDEQGGRGYITPGGETLKYMANVRLRLQRRETFDDGTFFARIKTEKIKVGGVNPGRLSWVCIIPGYGVSPEMTALLDCVVLGLASRGTKVTMPIYDIDKSKFVDRPLGYLQKDFIEWAKQGKTEKFTPFYEALMNYEITGEEGAEDAEEKEEE